MNITEFKKIFYEIKNKGYIKTMRNGPTGVGYTLEYLLGINENNKAKPDIEGAELKAHRINSNSMITLFTFNRKSWILNPLEAIKKYGSLDSNGRLGLYYTISLKPNSAGLFLHIKDKEISVRHISGEIIATWNLDNLVNRFLEKIPSLIFVSAFSEERDGTEYFNYARAQLMKGTSSDILFNQFKEENIFIDLRLHDNGTRARNHGTGFRTFESKLPYLFKDIKEL